MLEETAAAAEHHSAEIVANTPPTLRNSRNTPPDYKGKLINQN